MSHFFIICCFSPTHLALPGSCIAMIFDSEISLIYLANFQYRLYHMIPKIMLDSITNRLPFCIKRQEGQERLRCAESKKQLLQAALKNHRRRHYCELETTAAVAAEEISVEAAQNWQKWHFYLKRTKKTAAREEKMISLRFQLALARVKHHDA